MLRTQSSLQNAQIQVLRVDLVGHPKAYRLELWRGGYCKYGVFAYQDIEDLRDNLTAMLEGRESEGQVPDVRLVHERTPDGLEHPPDQPRSD
jgi:hypothetical protein